MLGGATVPGETSVEDGWFAAAPIPGADEAFVAAIADCAAVRPVGPGELVNRGAEAKAVFPASDRPDEDRLPVSPESASPAGDQFQVPKSARAWPCSAGAVMGSGTPGIEFDVEPEVAARPS